MKCGFGCLFIYSLGCGHGLSEGQVRPSHQRGGLAQAPTDGGHCQAGTGPQGGRYGQTEVQAHEGPGKLSYIWLSTNVLISKDAFGDVLILWPFAPILLRWLGR